MKRPFLSVRSRFLLVRICKALALPGFVCFVTLLVCPLVCSAPTARVAGVIFTVDANQVQMVWPNARVTLKKLSSGQEFSTVSNDLGRYSFSGVLAGDYELTAKLSGFEPTAKRFALSSEKVLTIDLELVPRKRSESIVVPADPNGIDTTSSYGGTQTLSAGTLKSLVRLNSDFQEALPLLPGVLRGPDGLIRIKGGNANQTAALINNASIGDPFTGQPALRLPTAAVESVRVLSNPFSAEYGGFSSGVIEVTTRGGGEQWKWLLEDPIPRFRWIDHRIHGVESLTPHLALSGPLIRGKLYLFQSLYYGYDTIRTPSLPDPDNIRIDERVNTQTQLDWDANRSHRLTAIFTLDPQDTTYANIDTFNPQLVTADYRQRGFFSSVSDSWILREGGFVQSLLSVKQLNSRVFPANSQLGVMELFPEQNSGTFFNSQKRDTWLFQWSQALHLRPINFRGRHVVTIGYRFSRGTLAGAISNFPVNVRREDHTLAKQITYGSAVSLSAAKNSLAIFTQDNWQIYPRFAIDLGVRLEHDSLSAEYLNVAPRLGFVFAPSKNNRAVLRGGIGLFYDKIPLNVATFPSLPAQTVTQFAADGATVVSGPTTFGHVTSTRDGRLRLPYSLGASFQFDYKPYKDLLLRLGYEHREGHREFFVGPLLPQINQPAQLQLLNSGRQSYDEFLTMVRWNASERTSLVASYVRSRAWGELNDYNQFFGNFPNPLIRTNQYGPLPSDAPDRVLFWGIIQLPRKLQLVPILDAHTGFPHSQLDTNWNYLGQRNQAGRFPAFASLDLKLQYPFDFKFRGHRIEFLGGVKVINVTNHYNPRDVQQYLASPAYGAFYNSVGRLWRIDGDFDF